jgi:hypothetical protein
MHRISLLGLALAFFLVNALGCDDTEAKKVDENPFKARQQQMQKEQNEGKLMMPKAPKNNDQ